MADQVINSVIDWIDVLPVFGIYAIFFALAYLENLLPPMPGDVLVAFGGYLAANGTLSFSMLLFVTVIASVIGFMNMYWLGCKWGDGIEEKKGSHFMLKFIDYKYFNRGKKWMNKWGQWVVFGNRFLAGTRSVISLTTGMARLNVPLTILNSFLSSLLWNAVLIAAGWYIQGNLKLIGHYLSNYGKFTLVLIVLIIIFRIIFMRFKNGKTEKDQKK